MSKAELLTQVSEQTGLPRVAVRSVLEALAAIGQKELKRAEVFTMPGLARFKVVKKPARKARMGINPFTKKKQMFKAKPASRSVRARPTKAVKDSVR